MRKHWLRCVNSVPHWCFYPLLCSEFVLVCLLPKKGSWSCCKRCTQQHVWEFPYPLETKLAVRCFLLCCYVVMLCCFCYDVFLHCVFGSNLFLVLRFVNFWQERFDGRRSIDHSLSKLTFSHEIWLQIQTVFFMPKKYLSTTSQMAWVLIWSAASHSSQVFCFVFSIQSQWSLRV